MQYQEAITEFLNLDDSVEAARWRQAQIAWEQVKAGESRSAFARDTKKDESYIRVIVRVWDRWGGDLLNRPVTFGAAYEMIREGVDSPDEAATRRTFRQTSSGARRLPPEQQATLAREMLADPDVARHTFDAPDADPAITRKARMHAGNAITDYDKRLHDRITHERHEEAKETGHTDQEALYEVSAMMQVLADVVVTGGKLAHKLSEGATLSSGMRHTLAGYATKAKATIEWLEGIEDQQHAEDVDEVLRVWAAEA